MNLDVSTLDFEDSRTWELLQKGDTDGVFQLESSGMKDTCVRVYPESMEDLIAILALYRPDTMSELEHYIRRKSGQEKITYLHPDLIPILRATYGCMIYQEQVMAITKKFAGFSDAEADKFRKGIGKKKPELVKEQAEKFRGRALENNYQQDIIDTIADDLKAKGGYMFNKGHSTGYSITAYKTAYLKANYPVQFMCALLSNLKKPNGQTDYESLGIYIVKCNEMGIRVKNPDINYSQPQFTPVGNDILFGFNLIKSVGSVAIESIVKLRPFIGFVDFLDRTENISAINKTTVVNLVKAGAFDFTGEERQNLLLQYAHTRFEPAKGINKTHMSKLLSLNLITEKDAWDKDYCLDKLNEYKLQEFINEWKEKVMIGEEFDWEFETLSYHLSGNPLDDIHIPKWDEYEEGYEKTEVAGTVIAIKKTKIKKGRSAGKQMAFITLDSLEGLREITVFSNAWERQQQKLYKGAVVVCRGKKQDKTLLLTGVMPIKQWKEKFSKTM